MDRFAGLNTQVLGISVDSVPSLVAWADSLGGISYPLLSDFYPHGEVAELFGVLGEDGRTERAIFIFDREGMLRYREIADPDIAPDVEDLFKEIRHIDPEASTASPERDEKVELPSGGIIMYCTAWCKDCRKAREWLKDKALDYTEVDVYKVPGAADQVRAWNDGYLVSPTFDIDGTIIIDFDKDRLREVWKIP